MTMTPEEFYKRYENADVQNTVLPDEDEEKNLAPVPKSAPQAVLQKVEQGGGALLTNAVRGISAIGQTVMGALEYLENNQGAYDDLFEQDKHTGFTWDNVKETAGQIGGFTGGAVQAGLSQGRRILQSDNLTELGQNSYTGVDFLKNLPGNAGEFYRNQDSKVGKFVTGVLGFGVEVLLDPTSKISAGAYKGGSALAGLAAKGGAVNARTADIAGRAAANFATGNWVGGAIAMTAREGAFATREKLVTLANKNVGKRIGKAAETLLEWGMGPTALTTGQDMKVALSKYAALREDLPKDMLKIANNTATVVSKLPKKQRDMAQSIFGELASASDEAAEEAALAKLQRLGIDRKVAAQLGNQYQQANLRLMDIIDTASQHVPGFEGLTAGMSEYHRRRVYRMFVDPKVQKGWLDHLVEQNTPGSFQLKFGTLGKQLQDVFGVDDIPDATDIKTVGDSLEGLNKGGMQGPTSINKSAFSKYSSGERQAALANKLLETEATLEKIPGRLAHWNARKERITTRIEALDTLNQVSPTPARLKEVEKLRKRVDDLDIKIETVENPAEIEKLSKMRNSLQARLEQVTEEARVGGPINNADEFDPAQLDQFQTDKLDLTAANSNTVLDGDVLKIKDELKGTPDASAVELDFHVEKPILHQLLGDLQTYVKENEVFKQSSVVGFEKNEEGIMTAKFSEAKSAAKDLTLENLLEFSADWAKAKGLNVEQLESVNKALANSIVYIPGSREFVSMVKTKGAALNELEPQMQDLIRAEIGLSDVNLNEVAERTLDPVWHDLFGAVDNFSVEAAEQGTVLGEIAAKAKLLEELRTRGLVVTRKELEADETLANLPGWVSADNVFKKGKDDTNEYFIQRTNQLSIEAIDRSLGENDKFAGLARLSNLFRRGALVTDPSAHATQFLGNMAMLQMMGFKQVFGDDVNVVRGMNNAFKSVMLNDDMFKDAVDNGVMVSQTILNEQQAGNLAKSLLSLAPDGSKDKVGALTNIFRIAREELSPARLARAYTEGTAGVIEKTGILKGTEARDAASLAASPAAMFQLSDQMTRMFAYREAVTNKTKDLLKSNPTLANFTQNGGATINWKALEDHTKELAEQQLGRQLTEEEIPEALSQVNLYKEMHKAIKEEAAQVANDIALNYSDVPAAISFLSKTGVVPFIKFQWKATGRIMEFIDRKPFAFSPYYAAQRNMNDAMNPDPDNFEMQRASLSPTVRDAMVIPTGGRDSMGRQEFIDMSRWLPFGMYANAANGGGQEGGLAMQPSSLVSTPTLDVIHSLMNMEEEKQVNQSTAAFVAQKLVETFGPAGSPFGGRRFEALAKAINDSKFYVDQDGNTVQRTPSASENLVSTAAALPETVGHAVQTGFNAFAGTPTDTTAMGNPKPQTAERPRTTVEQAKARFLVPGVGFSSDLEKTLIETNTTYDIKINELKKRINRISNATGANISPQDLRQIELMQSQITQLEQNKANKINFLTVGE